jgi:release factor glutamine methyltransferase
LKPPSRPLPTTWTIQSALDWTIGDLERNNEGNPRLAAQWLLSAATDLERIELYTNYDKPLSDGERAKLRQAIERRRTGEPLQYILGKAPFRRLELKVRPGILIPRPETEVLVDIVLEWLLGQSADTGPNGEVSRLTRVPMSDFEYSAAELAQSTRSNSLRSKNTQNQTSRSKPPSIAPPTESPSATFSVLDICTGTGCIALSLVSERADCSVTATDIDPAAVALAQENAEMLEADAQERLNILQGDLATELLQDETSHASYDAVVSNPPYVPTQLMEALPQEVAAFEPSLALDGGADGLDIYRRIVEQALILLKPGGLLACELHEGSMQQARIIVQEAGFEQIKIHDDLAQRPRFITALHPNPEQPPTA